MSPVPKDLHGAARLVAAGESTAIRHTGKGYAAIQLTGSADWSSSSFRGADLRQDLSISVELLIAPNPDGSDMRAGPYSAVAVPPSWESPKIGYDWGTAGVAFADIRRMAGGQQARRLSIRPYQPLKP